MLRKMKDDEFDKVFSVMEEAFPIEERRPYEKQKELLFKDNYRIYILPDTSSGGIKAFAAIYVFEDFLFVEHLATHRDHRNHGLGAEVLAELKRIFTGRICLEVELPYSKLTVRRINFYRRNGFYLNDYDYIQPSISEGKKEVPLRIMSTGGELSRDEFEKVRDTLYRAVYGLL